MPYRLLSFSDWSARVQLTIWSTLLVWTAVVAALGGVRAGLRYSLNYEFDSTLDGEIDELIDDFKQWYPAREEIIGAMRRKVDSHKSRDWYVRWVDTDHRGTVWQSDNAPARPLVRELYRATNYTVWTSETHRAVEKAIELPNVPKFYLRMGGSLDYIQEDVNRLTNVLAPVGIALCLLAPLGGHLIAVRAMKPVQTIIETTDRLRPQQLGERLKTRGVNDELDQLAVKINQLLDEIADHVRQNHDFLANAAHDLRSPLAAILSSVEVAMDKPRTAEEYQELLYSIHDECRHLATLVNQLMELAERDAKGRALNCESVPLSEVVRNALEMFDAVAEDRGITLKGDLDATCIVQGDRKQLRQVVTNLIDNAIKFTPSLGIVNVSVKPESGGKVVVLTVSDTGLGIPPDDLPHIFERFYRADKSRHRSEVGGNGLGLSICEAIVSAHGGTIQVKSPPGLGTTFTIALPVDGGSLPPSASGAMPTISG